MMTELLCRLFVRDRERTNDARVRSSYGTLSGVVGICANLLLCLFKMIFGFLTASLAITADAWNNLTDAGSSVISMVSFRIAAKPADRDHPFGHARIEYVASILVSFLILLIGAELLLSSFGKIFSPAKLVFRWAAVAVLAVSILVKLWLALFNRTLARRLDSEILRATASDCMMDALSTSAVLVSQIVFHVFGLNLDAYIGLAVAVLICIAGLRILNSTKNSILGEAPVEETVENIRRIVSEYPDALGIHDLLVHSYGNGHLFASLHIEVDGCKDIFETHDTIDCIERRISEELGIACTIHLDPIVTDDEKVFALRREVEAAVKVADERLSVHDFRFVAGPTHTNVIFDLAIPFELRDDAERLKDRIGQLITEINPDYFAVIQIDFI
ncbi:MAG: cation transporter [Clostridia bacterium]|nr:cation transporter [Clostridia bacterium]